MRDYAAGDVAAMDELLRRHGAALLGFLRAMTRDSEAAGELFQETWLRVIRKPGGFKDGSFRAWLWCIARNLMIDRSRRRRPEYSLDAPVGDDQDDAGLVEDLADAVPGPPDIVMGRELADRIAECVARLPGDQREVFLLRTQAGLTFVEIARLLRVPLNTALGRMHYAVVRLRRELGALPEGGDLAPARGGGDG